MNSLSWFIYLADTLPTFGSFTGGFLLLFGLFAAFCNPPKGESWFGDYTPFQGANWSHFFIVLFGILMFSLTPSKETIYLIAGSEAGEMVIQTPEAQQIMSDVHEVIRLQLQELKGESK